MSKQLLIYERVMPVSSQRHANWSVMIGGNYSFAQDINSVPLVAGEFPYAAPEYAIVFAGKNDVTPVVILGVRDHENRYVNKAGTWEAKYIPAFVRRYPFVFSRHPENENQFMLCIDEEYSGCNQEGLGERLFNDGDHEGTPYLKKMLEFIKQYQGQHMRTQAFCKKLTELDLLEPMQAQVTLKSGQQLRLGGFRAVNRDRLKKLSGDQLEPLVKTNELELIYLHLQSMRNLGPMMGHLAENKAEQELA